MKLQEPGSIERYDQIKTILREQKAQVQKLQKKNSRELEVTSISNSGPGLFSLIVQGVNGCSNAVELELSTNNLMHSVRLIRPFGTKRATTMDSDNIDNVLDRFEYLVNTQL